MAYDCDLVIRGGTVVDGSGGEPFTADVAVSGGKIAAVGRVPQRGREELDAAGLLVTPGFVDIHTHYDGQATWDQRLAPSSCNGVTTAVMGNCGVGFAPVQRSHHDLLIELMEGVEDIPGAALHEGLSWEWESFGDYLDALDRRPHDIDLCAQLPHGALRVYVMGERGAEGEAATPEEIETMGRLAAGAMRDGALGFSSSRTVRHRTSRGAPTPTLTAAEDELTGIADAIGATGRGVLQVISDFRDLDGEFGIFRRMVERSGRPLSISLSQADAKPDMWRELLERIEAASDAGLPMKGQVCGRPIGTLLGLQGSLNPFMAHPSYRAIARLPLEEKVRTMRDPAFRERLLAEEPATDNPMVRYITGSWQKLFQLGDPPDYEPPPERSVAARAQREGRRPEELAYDLLLERDGRELLYFPLFNYTEFNLDNARRMMLHRDTVLGLGDGGAHVGAICDASFPTYMLTHWGRDRNRGERLELSWIVRSQTRATAEAVGLLDRGLLARGMKADINLVDFQRLRLHPPRMAYDLPTGGRRLLQEADGYVATVVGGEVTYRDGRSTGALPGRVVRGGRPSPAAA
ncbi:MAG TPA: amidohydrolase family protein [Gammaproteobacteria bacterium]|nr:amidohydrolase family protein [Gammaproteobacteria bacterium]